MKIKIALLFVVLVTGMASTASGQAYLRVRSKAFLVKSANIVKQSLPYLKDISQERLDGTFDKAVKHQRYARRLFEQDQFLDAMHHSDYARRLAIRVYHVNNDKLPSRWEYTQNEKSALQNIPTNFALDERLLEKFPKLIFDDVPYLTDDALYDLEFTDYRP